MGYQRWDGALLIVDVSYVAPDVPTMLPTDQLPTVSIAGLCAYLPRGQRITNIGYVCDLVTLLGVLLRNLQDWRKTVLSSWCLFQSA